MLFYAGLLPKSVLRPTNLHLPYPSPKNSSDLRESHYPTRPGQGGHVHVHVHPAHPWLRYSDVSCMYLKLTHVAMLTKIWTNFTTKLA